MKRVVLTSSVAAVREDTPVPRIFTESSWNNSAIEAVETKGSAAGPGAFYKASKTLAEKAAWEFIAAHKSEISWDLVVINPPWLFGASLIFFFFFFRFSDTPSLTVPRVFTALAQPRADGRGHQHFSTRNL